MPAQRSNTRLRNTSPTNSMEGELVAECLTTTSPYFVSLAKKTRPTIVRASGHDGEAPEPKGCEVQPSSPAPLSSLKVPTVRFPVTPELRDVYRTKDGKKLTAHQWAVYDFILNIPVGKVTTYKDVALGAGGSPRSVGSALKNNPFCPYIPCHRVIASNLFVGGFHGEWGKDHKTGTRYNEKLEILSQEGVRFNEKGQLISKDDALWHP